MRRLLFVFGSLSVAVGATWACSFPDVTFGPDEHVETGVEAGGDVDAEQQPLVDGGPDALEEEQDSGPILIDGSTIDELIGADGGGKVDAAGCESCDCDGDNYNDLTKPGCENAGGMHDCDDNDSRVHPNQGFLFDRAESPRNGDWDCSGKVDKLWANEKTTCAGLTLGLGCKDIYGFTSPVACGERGSWLRCKRRSGLLALDCVPDEQKLETQLCK